MRFNYYGFFLIMSFVIPFATASGILLHKKVAKMHVFFCAFINSLMAAYFSKMFALFTQGTSTDLLKSGFSSLGAAFGLVSGIIIYRFIYPPIAKDITDAYFLTAPLMYSIAKIGCHFAGCCHGIPYEGLFHISYSNEYFRTGNLFPVQATESIVFFLIFVVCLIIYLKSERKLILPTVLILCGICKFLLAYLREEQIGVLISLNQLLCIVAVILGIAIAIVQKHKLRKVVTQSDL